MANKIINNALLSFIISDASSLTELKTVPHPSSKLQKTQSSAARATPTLDDTPGQVTPVHVPGQQSQGHPPEITSRTARPQGFPKELGPAQRGQNQRSTEDAHQNKGDFTGQRDEIDQSRNKNAESSHEQQQRDERTQPKDTAARHKEETKRNSMSPLKMPTSSELPKPPSRNSTSPTTVKQQRESNKQQNDSSSNAKHSVIHDPDDQPESIAYQPVDTPTAESSMLAVSPFVFPSPWRDSTPSGQRMDPSYESLSLGHSLSFTDHSISSMPAKRKQPEVKEKSMETPIKSPISPPMRTISDLIPGQSSITSPSPPRPTALQNQQQPQNKLTGTKLKQPHPNIQSPETAMKSTTSGGDPSATKNEAENSTTAMPKKADTQNQYSLPGAAKPPESGPMDEPTEPGAASARSHPGAGPTSSDPGATAAKPHPGVPPLDPGATFARSQPGFGSAKPLPGAINKPSDPQATSAKSLATHERTPPIGATATPPPSGSSAEPLQPNPSSAENGGSGPLQPNASTLQNEGSESLQQNQSSMQNEGGSSDPLQLSLHEEDDPPRFMLSDAREGSDPGAEERRLSLAEGSDSLFDDDQQPTSRICELVKG